MRIKAFAAAFALAASTVSFSAKAALFAPTTYTLDNGMQVVVVENHRVPVVSHMVWYRVGAADEPAGKSGIAHFLEHLMFKGTPDVPPGEFSKIVARNGGRDNAFTSSDYTAYYQNIAADRLELVMRMEADRMRNLILDQDNVRSELKVVQEERRSRTDNNPSALLHERVEAALFLNHPYRRPVIGWPDELAGLTLDDAVAYYRRWYAPNNAILVVAGDVKPEAVKELADKYYAPLKPETLEPRIRAGEPPQVGARRVELKDARVRQPSLSRQYVAPSYHSAADKTEPYALEVLAEILGGGATSRMYKELVVTQGLAAGASAWYDPQALDQSTFGFGASPRPGVAMDKLETAMAAVIDAIARNGVTEDEVRRATKRLRANAVYARDSLQTAARVLGEALTTGQTAEDVEAWPDRIAAVTTDQVNHAAKALLSSTAHVTGVLLPADRETRR